MSEPVPNHRKTSPSNWLHLALLLFSLPWLVAQCICRRLFNLRRNEISFNEDLVLSFIRRSSTLPLALTRFLSQPRTEKILSSPRFRFKKSNLYERVLQHEVAGYWLCKGPPGKAVDPRSCDIVVYYLHGGAYVSGHPGTFLLAALRISEVAAERGLSLSCFGLEYSLAPEAKFLTQVEQAVAGYRYLLHQNIDAAKIAVLGDSAGGHLALCLISSLQKAQLPKPEGGVFLESPWVDMRCSKRATHESNKHKDFISPETLLKASKDVLGNLINEDAAAFVDFTQPLSGVLSWKEIMPVRIWLSAGSHELLLSEIEEFLGCLEKCGMSAQFEVEEGGVHCWQGMKDVWDVSKYLMSTESCLPEGLLSGTANLANALLLSFGSIPGPTPGPYPRALSQGLKSTQP